MSDNLTATGLAPVEHEHREVFTLDREGFKKDKHFKKERTKMNVADIMALMQSNKHMDLPGILALCQDKGGMGGNNMWWIILLFLFIFNGNGFGGANRAVAAEAVGGMENLQVITSLYDRIAAAQAVSTQGFADLNTHLCSSISEVLAATRNQGDRNYDATRNVGDAVRECCCKLESKLSEVLCKVEGISTKIDLNYERTVNSLQAMESRLALQAERNQSETNAHFCKLENSFVNGRLVDENNRLRDRLDLVRTEQIANVTASRSLQQMQDWTLNTYTPTNCGK